MSQPAPLVSVLMTAYNRERYVAAAIESVLNSTYKTWELIVVDDCSTDATVEIARKYEREDARIKVVVNESNLGDYPNRNKAASLASGKYLKYLDADDLIYPYGLEQLIFYMEQFPEAGYGLCSMTQDEKRLYPFTLSPEEAYNRHYIERKYLFHRAPLSAIIKRSTFNEVGGFSGKQHIGDFELWHILSKKHTVVLMPQGITWYRVHDAQQMNDNRTDPFVSFKYLLLSMKLVQESPMNRDEIKTTVLRIRKRIARSVLRATLSHSLRKGSQMKKASGYSWLGIICYA